MSFNFSVLANAKGAVHEPFLFGTQSPRQQACPAGYSSQPRRDNVTVGDCLTWQTFSNCGKQRRPPVAGFSGDGPASAQVPVVAFQQRQSPAVKQSQQQQNQQVIPIQVPVSPYEVACSGSPGGGAGTPYRFAMVPPGTNPAEAIKPMEPVTIRIQAPVHLNNPATGQQGHRAHGGSHGRTQRVRRH